MDSESYWIKRAEEREQEWNKKSKGTIERELANYYKQALLRIEDDIAVLYGRFAKDNKLTYAEASKMLTSNEFKQWQMSMEDYLNTITDSKDNKLLLELNTLAMRKRISRLDKLYGDTLKNLYKLGTETEKSITEFLTDAYKDNYYKNLFDVGKSINIKSSAIEVDDKKISKVLNASWSGKNYSERIWKNTDNLAKLIKHEITDGFHRGVSIQKMSNLVQERMNVGRYEATRLVRTEMNYVQNQASLDSIKEAEMKYFIFLATLDKKTSTVCRAHDRKVYPVDSATPGTNMPPLHPHCRSTIAGNLTDYDTGRGKRTAKNKDGKRIIIPAAMNYDDYYKVYIEESMSFTDWKKANKKPKAKKNDIIKIDDIEQKINNYRLDYFKLVAKNKPFSEREIVIKNTGKEIINMLEIERIQDLSKKFNQAKDKFRYYRDIYYKNQSREAYDNWYKFSEDFIRIRAEYYNFCASNVKDTLNKFRLMGTKNLDLKTHLKNSKSKNLNTFLKAYDVYPNDWIKRSIDKGNLSLKSVKRGYYDDKKGIIALSGNGNEQIFATAIHELGHRMERVVPSILKQEDEFYKRRTENEKLQWMGKGYSKNELTRKDNFVHSYMGKDYGGHAYELVSMGFEMAYTDSAELLTDMDMAEWIFGMLVLL